MQESLADNDFIDVLFVIVFKVLSIESFYAFNAVFEHSGPAASSLLGHLGGGSIGTDICFGDGISIVCPQLLELIEEWGWLLIGFHPEETGAIELLKYVDVHGSEYVLYDFECDFGHEDISAIQTIETVGTHYSCLFQLLTAVLIAELLEYVISVADLIVESFEVVVLAQFVEVDMDIDDITESLQLEMSLKAFRN